MLSQCPRPYLTETELGMLFPGTDNSRYGKLKRLVAQKKLLHIRRGLYYLNLKEDASSALNPFELSQFIYGPSYVSLESALSFHGLIPEAVHTITCVTVKRSKEFHTPVGLFSYSHLPLQGFITEVQLVNENGAQFFMAKPWKAICDYIFCYKKEWKNSMPLSNNLRIDLDSLPKLQREEIDELIEYYHHTRVTRFLTGIQKEENLLW